MKNGYILPYRFGHCTENAPSKHLRTSELKLVEIIPWCGYIQRKYRAFAEGDIDRQKETGKTRNII